MESAADALRGIAKQMDSGMQFDMKHGFVMVNFGVVHTAQLEKIWNVKDIVLDAGGSIDDRLALAKSDLDNKCFTNAKSYLGYSDRVWPLTYAFGNVEAIHNTFIKLFENMINCEYNGGILTKAEDTYICSGPHFTDHFDGAVVVVLSDLVAYVREELSKFNETSDFYENLKAYAFMKIKSMKISNKLKALHESPSQRDLSDSYDPEWWGYRDVEDAFTNSEYDVTEDEVNSYVEELYLALLRKSEELLNSKDVVRYLSQEARMSNLTAAFLYR